MVNSLYWIVAVSYAIALLILLAQDIKFNISDERMDKSYHFLVIWVIFFCLQDAVWGIAAELKSSPDALFVLSMLFHIFTAVTTFVWLDFVLSYLGCPEKLRRIWLSFQSILVFGQISLVVANVFLPLVYSIGPNCEYIPQPHRPIAFAFQYIGYVVTAIVALLALGRKKEGAKRYQAVLLFISAPLITGIFLLMHPELPLNSMGYFFGCVIIHAFIVSTDREEFHKQQFAQEMDRQIMISNTDELTGCFNRHAYEEKLRFYETQRMEDFVYLAMDINGLKVVNDTKGHNAGDELIISAAKVLQEVFQPYGKVYRTGGDEFVALIRASKEEVEAAIEKAKELQSKWKGKLSDELSISIGQVRASECHGKTILEIAVLADKRMYRDKRDYYDRKGIDRRSRCE